MKYEAGQKVMVNTFDGDIINEQGIVINTRNNGTAIVQLVYLKVRIVCWEAELIPEEESEPMNDFKAWLERYLDIQMAYWKHDIIWGVPCGPTVRMAERYSREVA